MRWSKQQLNEISHRLADNIDRFLEYFQINYVEIGKMIRCECFIHGGDNKTALNIYHKADIACHYKCRTHGCERIFGRSLISMIRGLLSHRKFEWQNPGDREVSFPQTVEFIIGFLKNNLDLENGYDKYYDTKSDFNYIVSHIANEEAESSGVSRVEIRNRLSIPSRYFLNRGFSRSILDTYDVGECRDRTADMKYRAVVPIYDVNYRYIGATGRSIYERCNKCSWYHHPQSECMKISKWRHSKGLNRNLCLYNLNRARSFIQQSHVAVIVESPGNVWRLEEAGIHNAVAIFGTTIHETQRYLLDSQGAMAMIVIMDNDEAGQKAKEIIEESLNRIYGLFFPIIDMNDIGDMSINQVQKELKPFVDNIMGVYV